MIKIALSAGHRNTDSTTNTLEMAYTARWTPVIATTLRSRGFEVRVLQPHDGAGIYPGGLAAVAGQVIDWYNAGWKADAFIEIHGESTASRGVFAIYPDWGSDVDLLVRDPLGPAIARQVRGLTGLPLRNGTGVMSERQTGVGSGGNRLGIFKITAPLRSVMRRLIIECGSYGSIADRAIMDRSDFPIKLAAGIADALAGYYSLPATPPAPSPGAPWYTPDSPVIGVPPSITVDAWLRFLVRGGNPINAAEGRRFFRNCAEYEVDPVFIGGLWPHEGALPLGMSALQVQTHMPINIKAAPDEWRRTATYAGQKWHVAQTAIIGLDLSLLHIKNYHGAEGRHTVRSILAVHGRETPVWTPDAMIEAVLVNMKYMREH